MRLAYIVPTLGRDTLAATLASLEGEDVIQLGLPYAGDWGNSSRNVGIDQALAGGWTHVAYMDDDDVATPGAGAVIRAAIHAAPEALHLFRMRMPNGNVVWNTRSLVMGNIGTPCLVHPATVRARWGKEYAGDIRFATEVARELGRIVWHEDVVCDVNPRGIMEPR